jgi:hypothetical protein
VLTVMVSLRAHVHYTRAKLCACVCVCVCMCCVQFVPLASVKVRWQRHGQELLHCVSRVRQTQTLELRKCGVISQWRVARFIGCQQGATALVELGRLMREGGEWNALPYSIEAGVKSQPPQRSYGQLVEVDAQCALVQRLVKQEAEHERRVRPASNGQPSSQPESAAK